MIHMVSKDTRNAKMSKIFEKWPPSKGTGPRLLYGQAPSKAQAQTAPLYRNMWPVAQFITQCQHHPILKSTNGNNNQNHIQSGDDYGV